jgi:hypothetical protein
MMIKTRYAFFIASFLFVSLFIFCSFRNLQKEEPWSQNQLLPAADLARIINDPKSNQPYIFSVGPGAIIKNSIDIGPAENKQNLNKLKQQLSNLPKDANIVIYCGCCPFVHCPNIRPAFTLLNEMKFANQKLLNIEHNIKVDWISKGYPVNRE